MIKEKAKALAAAIKESDEFKGLQSAQARVQLDPNAYDLLQKLQNCQGKIIALQEQGQPITQDIIDELGMLENQIQLSLTLKNMVSAQQKFEGLMNEVNKILADNLN
mgnify:CR=1 FL=1